MSTHFDPVPLVGTGVDPVADIEDWLASPPVRALVEAFARTDQDHELARDLAARKGDAPEPARRPSGATACLLEIRSTVRALAQLHAALR